MPCPEGIGYIDVNTLLFRLLVFVKVWANWGNALAAKALLAFFIFGLVVWKGRVIFVGRTVLLRAFSLKHNMGILKNWLLGRGWYIVTRTKLEEMV